MSHTETTSIPGATPRLEAPIDKLHRGAAIDLRSGDRVLANCLNVIRYELVCAKRSADVGRARGSLEDVASLARSDALGRDQDYEAFIGQLTSIYGEACEQRGDSAYAATAASYAAVIEAISQRFPDLDFSVALGQLLELMTRLFSASDESWKAVYQHLRSVPDSVRAKQTLNRVCAADVREWLDAGVQNLFSLRDDLDAGIRSLSARAKRINRRIRAKRSTLADAQLRLDPEGTGKVVLLEKGTREREIAALETEKDLIREEVEGRKGTRALIESDIREFENRLRGARRAYYLRAV